MKINLNDETEFTIGNVAKLIASKDNSQHRQLRVTKDGTAFISDEVGNLNTNDLAFRLETFNAGNDYTGLKASQDIAWVERIYNTLRNNWPNPTDTYIDSLRFY